MYAYLISKTTEPILTTFRAASPN